MLDGIKVLELGRVFSGPLCGMVLADLGASVLKVERPGIGDESRRFGGTTAGGQSTYFVSLNRNKKSVALDLKGERDRALFTDLVGQADVLVHNWIQPSLDGVGFSYERCRRLQPRLVYCSISGYGQRTSFAARPAQDVIAQALSGFMSLTGEVGGPPLKTGIPVVDYVTGLYAAFSIVSALFRRERTGEGQLVEVSLLASALAMTSIASSAYLSAGIEPERLGNQHPAICPYNAYSTREGYIVVAVANDAMWRRLCAALGLDHLAGDERFHTNARRLAHRDELEAILAERFAALSTPEALAALEAHRVSCAPVNSLPGAFGCAAVDELGLGLRFDGGVEVVGSPLRFGSSPARVPSPPPALGEHDDQVRRDRSW